MTSRPTTATEYAIADQVCSDDDVEQQVLDRLLSRRCLELVRRLPDRERVVIEQRYGLNGGPEASLSEIGRQLALSRERVRQIETAGLDRLRGWLQAA